MGLSSTRAFIVVRIGTFTGSPNWGGEGVRLGTTVTLSYRANFSWVRGTYPGFSAGVRRELYGRVGDKLVAATARSQGPSDPP